MEKINWGIIATGNIAGSFATGLATSNTGKLLAVSSRSKESADAFAAKHSATHAYGSHAELLANSEIDAVYIATPHPFHAELAIAAAKAGKHILCEKPIAMNLRETEAIVAAAKENGVTLMEAFMYRCHPQTQRVCELIREGVIGEVKLIQAAFSFNAGFDPEGRLFKKELGGGGILDVGGYPASFACLIADTATNEEVVAVDCIGAMANIHPETQTDTLATTNLRFANGVTAQISVGTQLNQHNVARIYGTKGSILIEEPWIISRDGGEWSFMLHEEGPPPRKITGTDPRGLYGIEADHFAQRIRGETLDTPGISIPDTLRLNALLDSWRKQVGLSYPADNQ